MRKTKLASLVVGVFLAGSPARANAAEAWVVRAAALGQSLGQPFCNVVWFDRLT